MNKIVLAFGMLFLAIVVTACFKTANSDNIKRTSSSEASSPKSSPLYEADKGFEIIKTDEYEGAILESFYILDREIIDDFENGLVKYLGELAQDNGVNYDMSYTKSCIPGIVKNIKNYKRQYIGKYINYEKVLYCRFLTVDSPVDSFMRDNWYKQEIIVDDGGAMFFQIKYNTETKKYFDLNINGGG